MGLLQTSDIFNHKQYKVKIYQRKSKQHNYHHKMNICHSVNWTITDWSQNVTEWSHFRPLFSHIAVDWMAQSYPNPNPDINQISRFCQGYIGKNVAVICLSVNRSVHQRFQFIFFEFTEDEHIEMNFSIQVYHGR